MRKPKQRSIKAYDYDEIAAYIEDKYKIELRDLLGKFSQHRGSPGVEYRDFWHLICDDIHNGSYFYLLSEADDFEDIPEWGREIFELFRKEFGNEIYCYVSW